MFLFFKTIDPKKEVEKEMTQKYGKDWLEQYLNIMIQNENQAKAIYNSKIEKINNELGYSLTVKKNSTRLAGF